MFDIGFAELLVIAVLGLLILGPERLPGAIRTTSLWIGRLRRSFNDIRSEIEKEDSIHPQPKVNKPAESASTPSEAQTATDQDKQQS